MEHSEYVYKSPVRSWCSYFCNADVFAYAAAQVKKGLETAKELGAENYVFWGVP